MAVKSITKKKPIMKSKPLKRRKAIKLDLSSKKGLKLGKKGIRLYRISQPHASSLKLQPALQRKQLLSSKRSRAKSTRRLTKKLLKQRKLKDLKRPKQTVKGGKLQKKVARWPKGRIRGKSMKHKSKGRMKGTPKGRQTRPMHVKKRSKRKVEDDQVQLVLHKGRRMRQITKAGRTIYRPLRKTSKKHGWKTRTQTKVKKRKSDKARTGFQSMARAHNDLETSIVRKRRMYLRHKRMNDYLKRKLNTPNFLMHQFHKKGLMVKGQLGLTMQGLKPRLRMQTIQSKLFTTPMQTVWLNRYDNRGSYTQHTNIGGYLPQHTGTQVEGQAQNMLDKSPRYSKSRVWFSPNQTRTQIEKLIANRKLNAIQSKNASHAFMDERLNRGWLRHGKHK